MEAEGSGSFFLKIIHVGICSPEKSSCATGYESPPEDHSEPQLSIWMIFLPRACFGHVWGYAQRPRAGEGVPLASSGFSGRDRKCR